MTHKMIGMEEFVSTDWLSPKIKHGSDTGIPIIQSLNRNPRRYSQACFIAKNSLPNELVSIVVCLFECQWIGAQFKYTINPVLGFRVNFLPAKSASTYVAPNNEIFPNWFRHVVW